MRPHSHHRAIKFHHFCEYVQKGHIRIKWISTQHQLTERFTKLQKH
jgi:hypothetical protein